MVRCPRGRSPPESTSQRFREELLLLPNMTPIAFRASSSIHIHFSLSPLFPSLPPTPLPIPPSHPFSIPVPR